MNSMFTKIVRIFLGVILVLSGLNKFFELVPTPAGNLIESFGRVDYIFPFVASMEIFIGTMLLAKKWIAFALIILAPIAINILLFHLYLNFSGIIPAILIATLNGILIYKHWSQYKPLFN